MNTRQRPPVLNGALFGLGAALLFGASVPLAKAMLAGIPPFMLAGLFYAGSGLGLMLWRFVPQGSKSEATVKQSDLPWLTAAILFGGVCAPLLLMFGLRTSSASGASLLLNLESVFGAAIAWVVFREDANRRVVLGMVMLTLGAMLLSFNSSLQVEFSPGALYIVLACLCWGIDNNLTRKISGADPVQIAMWKGIVGGISNMTIAGAAGATMPPVALTAGALAVGVFSYGVSLVLYILGLRHVGAARTSAYFSAAPFIGAVASIVFLHDAVNVPFVFAAMLMAYGLWLHLTEEHSHLHTHAVQLHDHLHVHDEHHQHEHSASDPPGEPHSHEHMHEAITHAHEHMPDLHHIHSHED